MFAEVLVWVILNWILGVVMKKRNQLIQDILGVSVIKIYHGLEKTWWEIKKKMS